MAVRCHVPSAEHRCTVSCKCCAAFILFNKTRVSLFFGGSLLYRSDSNVDMAPLSSPINCCPTVRSFGVCRSESGHYLRGRSLKGRCNIRVYVELRSCVCVCVCVFSSALPLTPPYCGTEQHNPPPHPHMTPPRPRICTRKQLLRCHNPGPLSGTD